MSLVSSGWQADNAHSEPVAELPVCLTKVAQQLKCQYEIVQSGEPTGP